MIEKDVLIIGAGPVGLFSVFQAGMLGMKCAVVDSLEDIGGQCSALYPEKPIYDIPAYKEISGQDLVDNLSKQAAPFEPKYLLKQYVTDLQKDGDFFIAKTSDNIEIKSKIVLIAAGAGSFVPNRPPLTGIEEYEGKSVFYMVKDREAFAGKKVAIAGGGDSAVDWAVNLSDIAEKIYLIHRRAKFRAQEASLAKVAELEKAGKIEVVTPVQLKSLESDKGNLSKVIVSDLDGNDKALDTDILLPFFGLATDLGPIKNWGLEFKSSQLIVDQSNSQTNIEGIYAIGDVSTYEGKIKLILVGFSEAALALHDAYPKVFDGKALHFQYSTSKGVGE